MLAMKGFCLRFSVLTRQNDAKGADAALVELLKPMLQGSVRGFPICWNGARNKPRGLASPATKPALSIQERSALAGNPQLYGRCQQRRRPRGAQDHSRETAGSDARLRGRTSGRRAGLGDQCHGALQLNRTDEAEEAARRLEKLGGLDRADDVTLGVIARIRQMRRRAEEAKREAE